MGKRSLAAIGTCGIFTLVLVWAQRDNPADPPPDTKLPNAIGAIHPRISPDGNSIAFSYQGEIWTAPRTGGVMSLLTPGAGLDLEPTWSPDGKQVAFVRGSTVRVVQFPDGKEIPLPRQPQMAGTYAVNRLEFSTDGKKLLGAFVIDGARSSLAWFDLMSGDLTPLTQLPAVLYAFRFALSPDGKWVVHTAMPDVPLQQSGNDGSQTDLWKLAADGTGKPERLCQLQGRVHDLSFAEGGKSVIVAAELGQAHDDLWKLPLADPLRGMEKLTAGQADEDRPSVSRDGRWMVYADNRTGPTALMMREMASGEETLVGQHIRGAG